MPSDREVRARKNYDLAKGFIIYLMAILLFVVLSILVWQSFRIEDLAEEAKEQSEQNTRLIQSQDDILRAMTEESEASRERFAEGLAILNERATLSEQRTRDAINRLIEELNEQERGERDNLSFVDPVTGEPVSHRPEDEEERRPPSPSSSPSHSPSPTPSPSPSPEVCIPVPVVRVCIDQPR